VNNPRSYVRANVSHVMDVFGEGAEENDEMTSQLQPVLSEALEGIDRISKITDRVRSFTQTSGAAAEAISIKQIFEPFFATGKDELGTGLGLAISGKLVADFGGTLSYESADTGGARFVIELPAGSRS
jgi:C4-dicarboxylate-specific signal transduction histidine kinase